MSGKILLALLVIAAIIVSMSIFIFALGIGLAYEWMKGGLELD